MAGDGGAVSDGSTLDGAVLPPTGDVTALDAPAVDLAGRRNCTNVDLLFVIDSSGSMADEQAALVRSFPGFIDGIRSRLRTASSIHLGVATTSDTFENAPGCTELGSLIVRPSGPLSSNRDCRPFRTGANYLDQSQPDLAGRFACIGTVGTGGSDDEKPIRALLNALRPEASLPGRCNAGFLRRDSLLVVVLITDEDDVPDGCDEAGRCMTYGSGGTSEEWHRQVLALRSGIAENVVVLSLLVNRLGAPCGNSPAARLVGFTRRFGANGFLGDVCAVEYAGFFSDSLRVLENACANFVVPP